jgi:hypothetical protein
MKREELIALADRAAAAEGYAFHTGEMHLVNGTVRVYPAAWLAPVAVRSHTGRREGETTWRVTLHLMTLPTGDASAEAAWGILEGDALAIAGYLAASPAVCEVSAVGCAPAQRSLTVHGETSVALTCEVKMWFSR